MPQSMAPRICLNCRAAFMANANFVRHAEKIGKGAGRYCSMPCRYAAQRKHLYTARQIERARPDGA